MGSATEGFVWDVAEGMPTTLQDGTTRYITGPGGLPIEQVDGSGNTQYYLQDQLGSTRGLLDASGNIVGTYTFDPYGGLKGHGGTASTPFGYAGQYTDSESGLQYLRARYYDPSTQQFLTVDPLVGMTGQPYGYGRSNPANALDPTGLSSKIAGGQSGFGQWAKSNFVFVTLGVAFIALVAIALAPELAVGLGVASVGFNVAQLYVDIRLKHESDMTVAGDLAAIVLSVAGIYLGARVISTLLEFEGLYVPMVAAQRSGSYPVMSYLLDDVGRILSAKGLLDTRSIMTGIAGFTIGVLAAAGTGEAQCSTCQQC